MKNHVLLFFMVCTVLLMASDLEESDAGVLVKQRLLSLHLKQHGVRHSITNYLILKEVVKLGLTNKEMFKEIFRILFSKYSDTFPLITEIGCIKISPKIQGHLKYFANFSMLELEKQPFEDDVVNRIFKLSHDCPFILKGRCGLSTEIYIDNKVADISKLDFHDGAIVAVGDDGQKGIVWKSEFFDVANSFEKIKEELEDIFIIAFTDHAFAILNNQRKLHVFGDERYGGTLPEELKDKDISNIVSTHGAFAAVLATTHTIIVWGLESAGGAPPEEVSRKLKHTYITDIISTRSAFFALTKPLDGVLFGREGIIWGDEQYGGNPSDEIKNQLKNIQYLDATLGAFTVLTLDGNFINWGHGYYGGDPSEEIQQKLKEKLDVHAVKVLHASNGTFTVDFENDHDSIAWGHGDDPVWKTRHPTVIQLKAIQY